MTNAKKLNTKSLYDAILLFQRRARAVRTQFPSPLSVLEAITVSWLAHDPALTATALAQLLSLTKSKVSRLIACLSEMHCVEVKNAEHDRRSRDLSFTGQGQEFLEEIVMLNSKIAETLLSGLTMKERMRLVKLLDRFNTGLGVPALPVKPGENSLVPQQMRLVQGTGMLGRSYLDTGIGLAAHQILFDVARAEGSLSFSQILESLPFGASRLSRFLAFFEKKGIIAKATPEGDRRTITIAITGDGRKYYEKLVAHASSRIEKAVIDFEEKEILELSELLKLVQQAPLLEKQVNWQIRVCRNERERKQARAYLVRRLVEEDAHYNLDELLIPENSFCALIYRDYTIEGVCEVRPDGDTGGECQHLLLPREAADAAALVQKCFSSFFSETGLRKATLPAKILTQAIVDRVAPGQDAARAVSITGG